MVTLNDALKREDKIIWRGSQLSRSSVVSANADAAAEQIPIPTGALYVTISNRTNADFDVWVVAAGTAAPTKGTTAGAQSVNGSAQAKWTGFFDPTDPPELWIGETGGVDNTFDIVFQ